MTTETDHEEPSAAQPQPKKIRNGILAAKNAKDAKKESGFVGAGLKPALLDLALGQFAQTGQIIKDRSKKDTKVWEN